MEFTKLHITTSIPKHALIIKVLDDSSFEPCDIINSIIINFADIYLTTLMSQLNSSRLKGGKRKTRRHKKRAKRTKRNYKRFVGGYQPSILFFIALLVIYTNSLMNVSNSEVVQRIKDVNRVSDLIRNTHGTCALNSLLFLKSIDLPTFEYLTMQIIELKKGLSMRESNEYLSGNIDVASDWFLINGLAPSLDKNTAIREYIQRLKNAMLDLKRTYGFSEDQDVISLMTYPSKNSNVGHAVVIWLTKDGDIIIINSQDFYRNDIFLYSSAIDIEFDSKYAKEIKYLNNDKDMRLKSLYGFVLKNIDIQHDVYGTNIFESLHITIRDDYRNYKRDNELSVENQALINIFSNIQRTKDEL